jgi:HSP20 family protein
MLLDRIDPFLAEFDRLTQHAFAPQTGFGMAMDVVRRGDELLVRVDLPGVASEKIGLTLENSVLTITAERHTEYAETDQVLGQERFDGTISRRLRVPDWVDGANVAAEYNDGVLTVHLPLAEKAKPRRIEISTTTAPAGTQIES